MSFQKIKKCVQNTIFFIFENSFKFEEGHF